MIMYIDPFLTYLNTFLHIYTHLYSLYNNYMLCNAKECFYMVLVKNNNDIEKYGFRGIGIVAMDQKFQYL